MNNIHNYSWNNVEPKHLYNKIYLEYELYEPVKDMSRTMHRTNRAKQFTMFDDGLLVAGFALSKNNYVVYYNYKVNTSSVQTEDKHHRDSGWSRPSVQLCGPRPGAEERHERHPRKNSPEGVLVPFQIWATTPWRTTLSRTSSPPNSNRTSYSSDRRWKRSATSWTLTSRRTTATSHCTRTTRKRWRNVWMRTSTRASRWWRRTRASAVRFLTVYRVGPRRQLTPQRSSVASPSLTESTTTADVSTQWMSSSFVNHTFCGARTIYPQYLCHFLVKHSCQF